MAGRAGPSMVTLVPQLASKELARMATDKRKGDFISLYYSDLVWQLRLASGWRNLPNPAWCGEALQMGRGRSCACHPERKRRISSTEIAGPVQNCVIYTFGQIPRRSEPDWRLRCLG